MELEQILKEIKADQARAILNEAKSGGFMDGDIPESDADVVEESLYWVKEAYKSNQAGMKHDTIIAILSIAGADPVVSNPGYSSGLPPRSSGGYSETDLRDEPVKNTVVVTKKDDPVPDVIDDKNDKRTWSATKHNLPVPKDWEGEPVDFPRDISELTDKEVRRLSGEYNAYGSRAKWLLAVAISDLAQATHLRDNAYRVSIRKVGKVDQTTEKAKLKEVIDAEAREDAEFAKFDKAVLKHQHDVTMLKALVDIYSGNVDRLSREWTMRQDEWEKTR